MFHSYVESSGKLQSTSQSIIGQPKIIINGSENHQTKILGFVDGEGLAPIAAAAPRGFGCLTKRRERLPPPQLQYCASSAPSTLVGFPLPLRLRASGPDCLLDTLTATSSRHRHSTPRDATTNGTLPTKITSRGAYQPPLCLRPFPPSAP